MQMFSRKQAAACLLRSQIESLLFQLIYLFTITKLSHFSFNTEDEPSPH